MRIVVKFESPPIARPLIDGLSIERLPRVKREAALPQRFRFPRPVENGRIIGPNDRYSQDCRISAGVRTVKRFSDFVKACKISIGELEIVAELDHAPRSTPGAARLRNTESSHSWPYPRETRTDRNATRQISGR